MHQQPTIPVVTTTDRSPPTAHRQRSQWRLEAEHKLKANNISLPRAGQGSAQKKGPTRMVSPELQQVISDMEFAASKVQALEAKLLAARSEVERLRKGPGKRLDKLLYQNEVLRQGLKSASALYGQQLSEAKVSAW